MTNKNNRPKDAADPSAGSGRDLRQKAEALARERVDFTSQDSAALSPEEIRKTLHELRVHQIELEMQNEELRTAQAQIEAGRARYFDLYNLAPVGYATVSEKGLILETNLTAATLLSVNRGALVKQPISRFILKEDQNIYYLHRKKLFETGEPQECELRLLKPDGRFFWGHLTGTAAQAEDGPTVCRLVIVDITERKLAEEKNQKLQAQFQQAQKMESVGRLAGGVAHDYNNMLGVIQGYAELALDRVGLDEPLYADLEEIRKAAQRSADLTRQLLAFARKQTIAPRIIDLNDTVEGLFKMLRRLIGEHIALDWKPGQGLWPVKMDPAQIDQMLTNLCVNARDAIAGVGKITVETRNTALDEEYCAQQTEFTPGEYVELTVSDDGCGMDSKTLLLVFDPFFTTKEINKGTGLGLASVHGAVKQNNGFINVHSELDQGTTFKIYLPRHAAKMEPLPEKVPTQATALSHETILLVEDEPAVLRMTTIMLERQGYTVLVARSPGEAIRLAAEHRGRIELLLTDVVMPEMNGRDLAKTLSSIRPSLKRLFMSGYTANIIAQHGVLDAGEHFIQKPFSLKDLGGKLREVLK
ncbi:MAG: response regulator [Desulfatitalea sp.]|nr:response regulator [Desulfatitalea sp.]